MLKKLCLFKIIILTLRHNSKVIAYQLIGFVKDENIEMVQFHQSYSYEDFVQGIRPSEEGGFERRNGIFFDFCNKARRSPDQQFVFIIDEINRGNISKIFGELITLLEPSKRIGASEELRVMLPYSGKSFGVPENVYIIGTMNTADRSIALIDTALRRRFSFIEMLPDSSTLADVFVGNLNISRMLDVLNGRIAVLLDREHTIGHSYLIPLRENPTIENLAEIFEKKIIPLLQEYFYDDYSKIQLALGDNQKQEDSVRFIVKDNGAAKLFGDADIDVADCYTINSAAFKNIDAYARLQ